VFDFGNKKALDVYVQLHNLVMVMVMVMVM